MAHPRYTVEEIGSKGEALYGRELRARIEPGNTGKVLVIDVETGEHRLGDDYVALTKELLDRRPDAPLYTLRIGRPGVGRIGARRGGEKTVA